jgi:hypothetical protein
MVHNMAQKRSIGQHEKFNRFVDRSPAWCTLLPTSPRAASLGRADTYEHGLVENTVAPLGLDESSLAHC